MAVPTARKGRIALGQRALEESRGRQDLTLCRKSRRCLRFKRRLFQLGSMLRSGLVRAICACCRNQAVTSTLLRSDSICASVAWVIRSPLLHN